MQGREVAGVIASKNAVQQEDRASSTASTQHGRSSTAPRPDHRAAQAAAAAVVAKTEAVALGPKIRRRAPRISRRSPSPSRNGARRHRDKGRRQRRQGRSRWPAAAEGFGAPGSPRRDDARELRRGVL